MSSKGNNYDETIFDPTPTNRIVNGGANGSQQNARQQRGWHKVVISGISGMALGAGATYIASHDNDNDITEVTPPTAEGTNETTQAEAPADLSNLVDENVGVASSVNDDMSFSEAFASARAEMGEGAVFQWHGNIYSTYTAEEWDAMNDTQRDEFNSHFAWNQGDTHHDSPSDDIVNDDVTVVAGDMATNEINPTDVVVEPEEPEVEVLGVVHDPETDMNIAGITIDGQDVLLADLDNNETFDVAVADLNGDGVISEEDGEVVDISDWGLDVDVLGGFTDGSNDICADTAPDPSPDGMGTLM